MANLEAAEQVLADATIRTLSAEVHHTLRCVLDAFRAYHMKPTPAPSRQTQKKALSSPRIEKGDTIKDHRIPDVILQTVVDIDGDYVWVYDIGDPGCEHEIYHKEDLKLISKAKLEVGDWVRCPAYPGYGIGWIENTGRSREFLVRFFRPLRRADITTNCGLWLARADLELIQKGGGNSE